MPEKFAEQILASRMFAPFISFVGVAIMLLWNRETVRSRIAVAVLSAPTVTFLGVPFVAAWVRSKPSLSWLPQDGSIEGVTGFLVGVTVLNIVAILMRVGPRAEAEAASRIAGGKS